jgi:Outer membrane lipoprotein-sorting protein
MILRLSLVFGALLLTGFSEPKPVPKPFDPIEAAQQGRSLVAEILSQKPARNFTSSGALKIRDDKRNVINIPVEIEIIVSPNGTFGHGFPTNWYNRYDAELPGGWTEEIIIIHTANSTNHYSHRNGIRSADRSQWQQTGVLRGKGNEPFAGSDFWLCDLGLEFFHWPDQKILKSELRKSRLCRVLESISPKPAPGAYSRVVSWIDDESLGIIHAEAYDFQNKLLKEFDAKKIKKVKGEWQLEEMEINNVQTGSRTQIEFNFDK